MKAINHYGPWHETKYPPADLTPKEKERLDKVIYDMEHPSEEHMKEFREKWHEASLRYEEREALPPEEREAAYRKLAEENPICYSPPFPPVDPVYHDWWSVLLSAGILDVQMVKENGQIGFTVHQTQTVTLEKGKFYPIQSNGGEEQQKAFGKS